jgi:hypothetical protein
MKKFVLLLILNFTAWTLLNAGLILTMPTVKLIVLFRRDRKVLTKKVHMYEALLRQLLPYQSETAQEAIQSVLAEASHSSTLTYAEDTDTVQHG